jgi:phosphatidylserine decarboxylase
MPLAEWLASPEVKNFLKMEQSRADHEYFFRNPLRAMWANRDLFASPADGVVTLQGRFAPENDLIEVKGIHCTVNSLLGPMAIDEPALVCGIFMTCADVHWNRCPTEVMIRRRQLPPIQTLNCPMLWAERGLLDSGLIRKGTFGFMASNSRVVNRCFCGALQYTYYLVQIADSDINCIVPIEADPVAMFNQNERFGQIIWGSMVVAVLPLDSRYKFRTLCKVTEHVEAAVDSLVRIERRG